MIDAPPKDQGEGAADAAQAATPPRQASHEGPEPSLLPPPAPAVAQRRSHAQPGLPMAPRQPMNPPKSATAPNPGSAQGPMPLYSTRSVGKLAAELLRPKIKQWVEHNLERLVEQIIRKEITRITGR